MIRHDPSQSVKRIVTDCDGVASGGGGYKDAHQYNSIVSFITTTGLGEAGTNLTEYEELVQIFAKLLWKIDPRYSKLQAREKSFPNVVVNKFHNFNRPLGRL